LNTGINEPAHRSIGIGDCKAAALLCTLFSYVAVRLTGEEIRHAAVGTLEAIARADARFSSNRSETFDRNQA